MKRILLLFFMFVLAMTAMAQRTQKITYQAVVRDAGNRLVVYTPVRVDVTITSSAGSYFESLRDTTNANGLMYVLIGGNPGFEDIDWVEAVIKTVITIDGGETVTDEVTVTAVPFALQANYATNVSPTAPTIVAVYNQLQADSLALANRIAAERAHLDDTLSHYLMQEVQVLSISNDTIYLTGGSFVKLPAGFSGNYNDLTNLPDLNQYATNTHLNDTLGHYLMQEVQVLSVSNDTLYLTGGSWVKLPQGFSGDYNDLTNLPDLNQYATNVHLNDTLKSYLTINGLCDSIKNCDVITNLQTADSLLGIRITGDSMVLAGKIYSDSVYLKGLIDSIKVNVTNNTTNITNNTTNITNITNNIANLQLVDSTLEARIVADSTNLANNYYNKDEINDTLSHYLKEEVQALRISNDTIYLTGGSFVKLPAGFSGDYNDLTNAPTNVSAFNNDAGYLTSFTEVQALSISNDTIYLTGGSFVKLPAGFSGDYNELINKPNLDQYATNIHLNDTLGHYYVNTEINDTLAHYLQAGDLCDSIVKCGVIQDMRDSIQINATNITHVQTDINNITGDIISLLNVDSILAAQILSDSVLFYKTDSILLARILNDSTNLANNYYNKDEINDTLSHYLMQEVQALRLSNDTIYLTGGSFVKLPAGFSGDYNDLTNAPTNVSAFNNDAGYLTSFTEVQALSISNDTIYLTGGSFVKLPAGFSGDYNELINKPNLDQYATNIHLNDTLGHYYVNTEINDTLAHYLQAGDLCDSIVKCGVIQDMRDSIQINATNITHVQTDINNITGDIISLLNVDSILAAQIISDSVLFYKTDSILLARILNDSTNLANNYYNKDEINDTLSHYLMEEVQVLSISNDTIYLTGGSFVKLPAGFSGDYNDLVNRPTNVSAFNNDAGYLTSFTEVQALSISNDTIYLTGGSFVKLPAGFSGDYNDLVNRPTNVSAFNNDAGYLTSDSAVIVNLNTNVSNLQGDVTTLQSDVTNLQNADNVLSSRITTDSTALANRMDTLLKHVCDSVKPCVTGWISDSTRMVFDTLHSRYTTLKTLSDSLRRYTTLNTLNDTLSHYIMEEVQALRISNDTIYLTGGSFVKLPAGFNGDYNELINRPNLNQYVTNTHLNDTLSHYLQAGDLCDSIVKCGAIQNMHDSIQINTTNISNNTTNITNITNNITTITTDLHAVDSILNARITTDSTALANRIHTDSTALVHRMDTLLKHVCDSVKPCVTGWISDSTRMVFDTLHRYYATNDTLKNYYTRYQVDTAKAHIRNEIQNGALTITYGTTTTTFTANQPTGSDVSVTIPTPAEQVQANWNETDASSKAYIQNKPDLTVYATKDALKDSTRMVYDTLHRYYATKDTLKNFLTISGLCDSVMSCDGIERMRDSIQKVNAHVVADSLAIMDTLHYYYATNAHLNDTLGHYTTTDQIDTLLNKHHYLTSDSTVIVMMRDSIQKVNAHVSADSLVLAQRIYRDSLAMMDTLHRYYATNDTLKNYYTTYQVDTAKANIRNEIQNGTLTITYGSTVTTFTANQHTGDNVSVTIPTPAEQVQADWEETDALKTSFIRNKPNIRDSVNRVVLDSLYAANSAMNNAIDTIAGNNIHDSLTVVRTKIYTDSSALAGKMRTDSIALVNRIVTDSTALATRMDTLLKHVCDSVKPCVTELMNDTLRAYTTTNKIDTLIQKYGFATNAHLNDTLGRYTTTNQIDTLIKKYGYLTSDSAVIVMMRDSIQKVNAHVVADSLVIMDTLHRYYATKDTLKNFLTISGLCDSVMSCDGIERMRDSIQKVNAHVVADSLAIMDTLHYYYATNAHLNDTLGHYTTTDQIDTLLNKHHYLTSDSTVIVMMRDSIYKVNTRLTLDSTALAHRMDTLLKHVCDSVQECVTGWMGDTLKAYTTTNKIDTLIQKYGYLTSDSAVIVMMRDSIQKVNAHVVADSLAIMDTLHKYYATNDTLKNYYTIYQVDTAKAHIRSEIQNGALTITYGTTTTTFTANQPTGSNVTVEIPTPAEQVQANWNETDASSKAYIQNKPDLTVYATKDALKVSTRMVYDTLHRYYATKDTLKNFLTISGLCDSVMSCDGIERMRDSIQKVNAHVVADSLAIMDTLHRYYVTNAHLNDTLGHYTTTDQIDTLLNKHHYLTSDSTVIVMMRDSIYKVNNRLTLDSTVLAHRMDTLLKHVCDSVQECVTNWMGDTLKAYTTTNQIDTLIKKYGYLTSDSAVIVMMRDSIQKVNAHVVADSLTIMDTLHKYYATNDTLNNYYTRYQVDTAKAHIRNEIQNGALTITYGTTTTTFTANQPTGSNVTVEIPTPAEQVQANWNETDASFKAYIQNKPDLTVFATKDALRDSIQKVNNRLTLDSTALAHRMDTLLKHVCDSVQECVTGWIKDSTSMVFDTLHKYYATKDTLKNFEKKSDLCKDVMVCIGDTLSNYTTTNQIDTLIRKYGYLTSDSAVIVTMRDSIQKVNNRLTLDSTALAHRMDTLLKHVCDSVKPCVTAWISDSTRMVFDTLHNYYTSLSTLADSMHRVDVRIKHDSLEVVELYKQAQTALQTLALKEMADSLTLATRMDTVYKHLCDSVMNCDGIKTMQTNITDVTNNLDSSKTNIRSEISSLNTKLQSNIDSTSQHVRGALRDTAAAIRNSIGKGTLTIQYGTDDPVTFNANQKTDTSIIIPVPTAPNDATLTIQKNGTTVGTFTANQAADQTIDITVPTCDSLAECDLIKSILARLDKLERQNDSLAKEIEKLKPNLTVTGPQKDTVCYGSTKSVTYTATFHNCSSSDYTLAWKVNGADSSAVTGAVLTLNVENEGSYKVVCIATRSDNTFVTDTVTTIVSVDTKVPSFTVAITGLTVTLSNVTNTATIQWDTDSMPESFTSNTHTYSVADTITITATSERGCTFTKDTVLQPIAPVVTTDSVPASTIAATTAKAYGTVTSDGGIPETKRGMLYSTSNLNLEFGANGVDSVMNGTGKGNYACTLERLVPCTKYYVRAFAYNEVDTVYGVVKEFTTPSFTCGSTLYDIDGNDYATLLLGSQCWMKQNLRVSHYANGDTILLSTSTVGTELPYRYEPDSNLTTYGYLYNWYAAMAGSSSSAANPSGVQGVCPDGWHLPSDAEWTQLTDFVASYDNGVYVCGNDPTNIGKSMVSQQGWPESGVGCNIGNTVATNNSTQFSIPSAGTWDCGGGVGTNGVGYSNNGHAIFLSATENDDPTYSVYCREFYYMEAIAEKTAPHKTFGRSVRCVLDCSTGHTYLPTVSTVSLTHTGTTVSMAASVVSDGGAEVTARGVCWSDSQHPTISSTHKVASGTGIGNFAVTEDLIPGATYYVRAYATNSEGTAYGAEVTYVVPNPMYPPTVNTGSKFLALTEGFEGSTLPSTWTTIDHDGDGYTWYRSSNNPHNNSSGCATSDSYHFIDDNTSPWLSPNNYLISPDITIPSDISPNLTFWYSGYNERFLVKVGSAGASSVGDFNTQVFGATTSNTGSYSQATVDLSSYAGQTFRLAFVHNGYYGNYQLYIDDIEVGEAGAIVSDITATTALCGGFVTDDGGATVTARGVCWSTSQNPTVSDSHTTDGSGTGSFTSNITGLNPLTTYYVRAYATNSAGTSYGSQVSFKTTEALAKVTTSVVSDVTIDNTTLSATCGGNVTDIGAYAVTARGVCWGTSTNPTISDSHTTDGSGLGSFTSNITGLTGGTYYVRAYATNSAGTAYGNQVSFTLPTVDAKSCSSAPVATDHEGNMYATVQIGTQCWMRENLRTTTSPKTGTKLALPARNSAGNVYSSLGSKVAHWYMNDSTTYAPKGYGLLYNWCAAMDTASPTTATATYMEVPTPSNINGNNTSYAFNLSDPHRGICPAGWHVPSYQDWNNLKTTISEAGKLAGGNDWESSSNATAPGNYDYADRNDSKFTALPVGKFNNYNCDRATTYAYFWCSMQMGDPTNARCLYMTHSGNTSTISYDGVSQGMSVRCVKD